MLNRDAGNVTYRVAHFGLERCDCSVRAFRLIRMATAFFGDHLENGKASFVFAFIKQDFLNPSLKSPVFAPIPYGVFVFSLRAFL